MNQTFQRCNRYTRCEIAGVSYLLPFGQSIADHQRGLQINDAGACLWELLAQKRTFGQLLELFAGHYEAGGSELPLLKSDLEAFLKTLDQHGLLRTFPVHKTAERTGRCIPRKPAGPVIAMSAADHTAAADSRYVRIGGLTVRLCGPGEAFSDAFAPFTLSGIPASVHQIIRITDAPPLPHAGGTVLIRNAYLMVSECPGGYVLHFPDSPGIEEAHLAEDGSAVTFYCRPPFTDRLREDLFHALRLPYLYLAQKHGILALHSASLRYRERAWLFSGPAGTGKSTHTGLWNRLYDTPILNGDLNLITLQDGVPLVLGLPWCGTSGISTPDSCPLGGIILLKQAPEDRIGTLSRDRRILLAAQRLISPAWTESQLREELRLMEQLEPHLLICRLFCTKEPHAAETARYAIDYHLDHPSADRCPGL